jgi:hypothetical protein
MATINLGAIKFNWKGAYNNSTAYAVDDVVSSSGSSYVCILASTGNAVSNGTYWNIMSSAGTNGSNGTDLNSTLTTRGDLVFKDASALARLAKGTAGQVLGQGANDPAWVNGSSSTLTTQGDILYRDGSGLQRLAKGTAGQVLKMNSSANAPEYGDAGGGAFTLLSRTEITSSTASLIFSNFSDASKYDNYMLQGSNTQPVGGGGQLLLQVGTGSSSFSTSGYQGHITRLAHNSSSYGALQGDNLSGFVLSNSTDTSPLVGAFTLFLYNAVVNPNAATHATISAFYKENNNVWRSSVGGFSSEADSDHTHLKLLYSNTNISKGIFSLYGINKS